MKITIENQGLIASLEYEDGVGVASVLKGFCQLMVAAGYSQQNIIDLFTDDGQNPKNHPWEWDVL